MFHLNRDMHLNDGHFDQCILFHTWCCNFFHLVNFMHEVEFH
jgi:hypothetical protein